MTQSSDMMLRQALGPTLLTASVRALLFLAAFSFVGGLLAWLIR